MKNGSLMGIARAGLLVYMAIVVVCGGVAAYPLAGRFEERAATRGIWAAFVAPYDRPRTH